jgi:hypothetical protein
MTRHQRDLTRLLHEVAEPYGAAVSVEKTNGGHYRASFTIGGQTRFIVASSSPSDFRAYYKVRADARRVLTQLTSFAAPCSPSRGSSATPAVARWRSGTPHSSSRTSTRAGRVSPACHWT